jgi:fatty-acyl-CoA synthase
VARLTYRQLDERSNRLANALSSQGWRRGDRIAALSTTRPEFAELYLAAAKISATVVGLNIRMHIDELAWCVDHSRPGLLFTSPDQAAQGEELCGRCESLKGLVGFGSESGSDGGPGYEELLSSAAAKEPPPVATGEDIHNVLYTSGTTGRPKGALISQRAAVMRGIRVAQWYSLGPDDGFVGWLPMFHTGGAEPLYATLLTGGRIGMLEKAQPEAIYRLIERERLTWTFLLPGLFTEFLQHPRRTDYDLSSMRFAIGYANMMPQVVKTFTSTFGIPFWDAFGQTETSFLLAQGLVAPGEEPSMRKTLTPLIDARIVDDEMSELPPGQPGECVVRGPSLMSGYLDDERATKDVFRGGWLHTGDVLVRNDDGTLSYVDRLKYLIKTGGENVYPAEVEDAIVAHAAVQEVCVHGVPDPYWGEAIRASVVLTPGAKVSAAELVSWCRERLAGYKRPRYVQFLTEAEIPRSTTGKVMRHKLAELPVDEEQRV